MRWERGHMDGESSQCVVCRIRTKKITTHFAITLWILVHIFRHLFSNCIRSITIIIDGNLTINKMDANSQICLYKIFVGLKVVSFVYLSRRNNENNQINWKQHSSIVYSSRFQFPIKFQFVYSQNLETKTIRKSN